MARRPARRPLVGKWFFRVGFFDIDWMRNDQFGRVFRFTLIKLNHDPREAVEPVHGKDYSGISFRLCYRVPFYVERWR